MSAKVGGLISMFELNIKTSRTPPKSPPPESKPSTERHNAKLKYEQEYAAIKDKIAAVSGTWGNDISQDLKDKRKAVVDLDKQVTDLAGALEFPQAVDLMTKQDLAGKVGAAELAKQTWDQAKVKYEKDYGDNKDKIAAVLTTWGDDISSDLKILRTNLDGANKKVTDEAAKLDFPKALQLMGTEKLGDKLTAAENGKKACDDAKVKYDKDYGDIKGKITAALTTWTDNISVDLKNLRTALDGSNKKVTDEAAAFDYPKAVQLMGTEKLGDKLTAAENGKKDWDTAKTAYQNTFVPLIVRLNAVINWPAKISTDLKDKRTKARAAAVAISTQAKIFEFVKAVELTISQDVANKLTAAENAKTTWDQAKAKYPPAKEL